MIREKMKYKNINKNLDTLKTMIVNEELPISIDDKWALELLKAINLLEKFNESMVESLETHQEARQ